MKSIKGAIFDMDGTLTDSMYIWDILGITYLKSQGKTAEENLRERLRPLSLVQAAELFRREYGVKESIDEMQAAFTAIAEEEYRTNVVLKPGVRKLLTQLKETGIIMAVATSSPREVVTMVLERLGIASYFTHIVTCGDVGLGKDHPAVYDRAAELMECDQSNIIVFEDALHAITTAHKAGYYVVGVYDESEGINEDQIVPLCDEYYRSLEEFSLCKK